MALTRKDVSKLFNNAENLRDYPGSYFPALAIAAKAMQQWREENPQAAAEEDALMAELAAREKARRKAQLETGFIGRGLD